MEPFTIMESSKINETRCVVVGFDSSGNSVVDLIESKNNSNIELIRSDEDIEKIEKKLQGIDIVFVIGALGKKKEWANGSLIAKMAKDAGALTVGVVAIYFEYEVDNFEELKKESDSVIIVSKELALNIVDIIEGIRGVIFCSGENDINLDFIDLKTVMSRQGIAVVGIGNSWGENAAYNAINNAIEMANMPIKNASGILVHFTIHPKFDFMQLSEAMDVIHRNTEESADVIFGTTTDETLAIDSIRVVLVATGFEKKCLVSANNIF